MVSNYHICKKAENTILDMAESHHDQKTQPLVFFWLPTLLIYLSIEVGSNRVSELHNRLILPREDKLTVTIIKNFKTAQTLFKSLSNDFGFNLTLEFAIDNASLLSSPQQHKQAILSSPASKQVSENEQTQDTAASAAESNGASVDPTPILPPSANADGSQVQNSNCSSESSVQHAKMSSADFDNIPDEDKYVVAISFSRVYPQHIYTNLSLEIGKALHYADL